MLLLLWLGFCLIGGFLLLLPFLLRQYAIYQRYSGARPVACPENRESAAVTIDARRAAVTGLDGRPDLRLCDCTRWPERAVCNQACLSEAVHAPAYEPSPRKQGKQQIYHLPVFLAAFVAWYLGAIWHSHYMFRSRWTVAVGLTRADVKQMVWWIWPHLLTVAVCLLFAYGVAWLLTVAHRKGVLAGVLMAVLLCGALGVASAFSIAQLPHELLAIEAGYVALATLTMGAIVGGLYDKLVLPSE